MFAATPNVKGFVLLASALPVVLGDFMIYLGAQTEMTPGSGNVANDNAWIVSGEPACKGGFPTNSGPTMMNPFDDVSFLENGFNCDGCGGTDAPIKDYDIERFEFWDPIKPKEWDMYGNTNEHLGYITLYQEPDKKSYHLVSTKKIGDPFTFWGTCTRAPPTSDDFSCSALIVSTYGKHVLTCTTPLQLAGQLGPDPKPPAQPTKPPALPPAPRVRIMVAGDSLSQGMENDFTCRWRLFAWIEAQGHATRFVGPESGTSGPYSPVIARPLTPPFPGESPKPLAATPALGVYASGVAGTFLSSGHASLSGRQVAQAKDTIQEWVRKHEPRFLLVMLGLNDLEFGRSDAAGLLKNMKQCVHEARKGKANVQILIGNIVHRSFIREALVTNTNKYNTDLRTAIPSWSTTESPIIYVDVQGNYDCNRNACPDGYDGLNPNSKGEYHIAQAFAKVLKANHGFTGTDFSVPFNPEVRTVTVPTGLVAFSMSEGLYIGWARVDNARGYEIRSRLQGQTNWLTEGTVAPNTNAAYWTAVTEGQNWEFQVRAKGDNSDRSNRSTLVGAVAHPKSAPAPINIVATPRTSGLQVTWNAVTGYDISRYAVSLWDQDTVGSPATYGTSQTNFVMDALPVGHRIRVSVSTWVNLPAGPAGGPASSTEVTTIGASRTPSPPKNIEVFAFDTASIQLGWQPSGGAEGYYVYTRYIPDKGAFVKSAAIKTTTIAIGSLLPAAWNFQFCVVAIAGGLESDLNAACIIPPAPPKKRQLTIDASDAISSELSFLGYIVFYREGTYAVQLSYNVTLLWGDFQIVIVGQNTTLSSLPASTSSSITTSTSTSFPTSASMMLTTNVPALLTLNATVLLPVISTSSPLLPGSPSSPVGNNNPPSLPTNTPFPLPQNTTSPTITQSGTNQTTSSTSTRFSSTTTTFLPTSNTNLPSSNSPHIQASSFPFVLLALGLVIFVV